MAYRIEPDRVAKVKEYLDIREINGYTIHYTPFHPAAGVETGTGTGTKGPLRTLVYIGTPDNEQFVGPQDPQALAEHIYRSEGPSGLNRDYLWGLEKALDELSPESGDEHVSDLSRRVRAVAARETMASASPIQKGPRDDYHHQQQEHPQHHEFRRAGSVDEQEETEKTV